MTIDEILNSKFSEPAIIFSFEDNRVTTLNINSRYLPELGMNMDEQEFIRADSLAAFDESNLEIYLKAICECLQTGEEVQCETWRHLISNCCGSDSVCIKSRFIVLDDAAAFGEGALIYESIRNITGERRHIDELTESERRFKLASDQINIYYWEYNIITKEMRPCFRCMRDLGLPALVKNYPEPVIEMGIVPADYADTYRDVMKQVDSGVPELEVDIPLTVGHIPFRFKYTTDFDENGNPVKAFGSATLITETELKRAKLDSSIINSLAESYDGIFIADLNTGLMTTIRQENLDMLGDLSGLSCKECVEKVRMLFDEEHGKSIEYLADTEHLKHSFFLNETHREFNLKCSPTGQWIRLSYRILEKSEGVPIKLLVTYTILDDVRTQAIEADRLIAAQKTELEANQKQLIAAVDAANEANKAKSDFLARMSHEIRTPMNAIMGMNEIILKSSVDDTIKSYAQDAYKAATGLLGTINEILDFSKIESGKMELVESSYNSANLFGEMYTMFALRAEDKNLALVFDVDSNIPLGLYGDEMRIRQILTNLLSNAIKYTDKGSITLEAKLLHIRDMQATILFSVKDTGRGIREEDLSKLYEAFTRIDELNNKNIEGTGLGMNIVSKLLNLMGSTLEVGSIYGEGTTFAFTLKQKITDINLMGDFRHKLDDTPEQEELELYTNPNGSILIVDDNVINLKVIKVLLKNTQLQICAVTSGETALQALEQKHFDMVMLDHFMPGMDGIETLHRIKALQDNPNASIPVIALTANAIKGAEEMYRKEGFTDVLYKPATMKDINAILWKYLR